MCFYVVSGGIECIDCSRQIVLPKASTKNVVVAVTLGVLYKPRCRQRLVLKNLEMHLEASFAIEILFEGKWNNVEQFHRLTLEVTHVGVNIEVVDDVFNGRAAAIHKCPRTAVGPKNVTDGVRCAELPTSQGKRLGHETPDVAMLLERGENVKRLHPLLSIQIPILGNGTDPDEKGFTGIFQGRLEGRRLEHLHTFEIVAESEGQENQRENQRLGRDQTWEV